MNAHQDATTPFLLLTECGIASRLQAEHHDLKLVGACAMCRYMRSNSLEAVYQALKKPKPHQIIKIDSDVMRNALRSLEAMFKYAECNFLGP